MTEGPRLSLARRRKRPFARLLRPTVFLVCLILLLWQSDAVGEQLRQALSLCGRSLIPSLFPFLILSELISATGLSEEAGRLLPAFLRRLLGLSEGGSAALLLGMLCGFPIGARLLKHLYEEGGISKREAERLLPVCSIPSPAFLIGTVGGGIFHSFFSGLLLYGTVVLASLLVTWRSARTAEPSVPPAAPAPQEAGRPFSASLLTQGVLAATDGMLRVCAFVVTFSCLGGLSAQLLRHLPISVPPVLLSLIRGIWELTGGLASLPPLSSAAVLPVAAAISGWCGLSVHAQLLSLCGETFSFRVYWRQKAILPLLCALLMLGITSLL